MSTEPDLECDANLPAECVEVEAALRRFAPSAATVNRDELMYRAGWEAARAQKAGSRVNLRVWQSAAGALAATLLFVLMQSADSEVQRPGVIDSQPLVAATEHEEPVSVPENPQLRYVQTSYLRSTAPLLVMRSRALNQDFSERPVSAISVGVSMPTVTTSRQLLEEFLPRS